MKKHRKCRTLFVSPKTIVAVVGLGCLAFNSVGCSYFERDSAAADIGGGAALGAGLGAVVGSESGNTATGAAIGAASGGAVGGLIGGPSRENVESKLSANEELLRRQQVELDRQHREFEALKRQQYYDRQLEKFEATKGQNTSGSGATEKTEDPRVRIYNGSGAHEGSVYSPEK
jgi:hypothetical protein